MSRTETPTVKPRTRYNAQFRSEALALADKLGAGPAAKQLRLYASQPA